MDGVEIMNIFVYSDESGVLDKVHNNFFVFGGIVFLSKQEKDVAARKYIKAERCLQSEETYGKGKELKANILNPSDKRKLYRSMNQYYKFAVVVDQKRVLDRIMCDKKSKQRYLDYVYKIGVKRLFERLIAEKEIVPEDVENIYFFVDEHTTSTNGLYELRESLEEEFKRGMYSPNYMTFFPPIFPKIQNVSLNYCNSEKVTLVRAADIIANRVFHDAVSGDCKNEFEKGKNNLYISFLP